MFTSDSFDYLHVLDAADPIIAEPGDLTVGRVKDHLLAKFDWLVDADVVPVRQKLREIFETYPIETIAPGHGRIIRGSKNVRRFQDLLDGALAAMSQ